RLARRGPRCRAVQLGHKLAQLALREHPLLPRRQLLQAGDGKQPPRPDRPRRAPASRSSAASPRSVPPCRRPARDRGRPRRPTSPAATSGARSDTARCSSTSGRQSSIGPVAARVRGGPRRPRRPFLKGLLIALPPEGRAGGRVNRGAVGRLVWRTPRDRLRPGKARGTPAPPACRRDCTMRAPNRTRWQAALAAALLTGPLLSTPAPVAAQAGPRPAVDRYGDPLPTGAIARFGTLRFRQGSMVGAVTVSPDGNLVVS